MVACTLGFFAMSHVDATKTGVPPRAPEHLFKYISRDVGRLVLTNRTLRWSTPGTLNDPYDMQFDLRLEVDKDAVKTATLRNLWEGLHSNQPAAAGNQLGAIVEMLRGKLPQLTQKDFNRELGDTVNQSFEILERLLPSLQAELRAVLANCKILCLTAAPDSMLMWERYAEKCKGIVLRFRNVPGLDSPWSMARPVTYLTNMPLLVDNDFLAEMLSGRISMDHESILHKMVYTKAREWAYEGEWRIFSGTGRDPRASFEDVPFNELELDAVICGHRMPEKDRETFSEIVLGQYPHAQILQAKKTAEIFFRLKIVSLEAPRGV
jgi:hypothetical protein